MDVHVVYYVMTSIYMVRSFIYPMCWPKHATSKIYSVKHISTILTMKTSYQHHCS